MSLSHRKACIPYLAWALALFGPTCIESGASGVPRASICCIGCSVGIWSPSLNGDLELVTCLGRLVLSMLLGSDEACVEGYLARIHQFTNSCFI
jgi:hypothetical protein